MSSYYDADQCNDIAREDLHQQKEERVLKNKVLRMRPGKRKSELWKQYFVGDKYTGEIIDSPVY